MYYLAITNDEYELPVALFESAIELCRKLKYDKTYINYRMTHSKTGVIYLRSYRVNVMRLDENGEIVIGKNLKENYNEQISYA